MSELLTKYKLKINGQYLNQLPEVVKGQYEGGFKLWECEKDGCWFFEDQQNIKRLW
jgi:hypothetical protein